MNQSENYNVKIVHLRFTPSLCSAYSVKDRAYAVYKGGTTSRKINPSTKTNSSHATTLSSPYKRTLRLHYQCLILQRRPVAVSREFWSSLSTPNHRLVAASWDSIVAIDSPPPFPELPSSSPSHQSYRRLRRLTADPELPSPSSSWSQLTSSSPLRSNVISSNNTNISSSLRLFISEICNCETALWGYLFWDLKSASSH